MWSGGGVNPDLRVGLEPRIPDSLDRVCGWSAIVRYHSTLEPVGPKAGGVSQSENIELVASDAIDEDIGRMYDNLAGLRHPPGPTDQRLLGQSLRDDPQEAIQQPVRRLRICGPDAPDHFGNIAECLWRPARGHPRAGTGCGKG